MRNLIKIVLTAGLVLAIVGPALAAFDAGNMLFVAYEEDEGPVVKGRNDQPGFESFFDLGVISDFTSLDPGASINTSITLDDFNTGSWGDVYVASFGLLGSGLGGTNTRVVFSSDAPDYTYNAVNFGFDNGYNNLVRDITATDSKVVVDKQDLNGTYKKEMQASGDYPGFYGGSVSAGTTFGAELNLAGISSTSSIAFSFYGGEIDFLALDTDDFIDPDGDFVGQFEKIFDAFLELDDETGKLVLGIGQDADARAIAKVGGQDIQDAVDAGTTVTLDGSGSSASSTGQTLTYAWSGPENLTPDAASPIVTFSAPPVPQGQVSTLDFSLTVTDDQGFADTTTISVKVRPITLEAKAIARRPDDQEITGSESVKEGTLITLDGSESKSDDGSLKYTWVLVGDPLARLQNPNSEFASYVPTNVGTAGGSLTFKLEVENNNGDRATDTVTVLIEDNPPAGSIAALGDDQPISDPVEEGTTISLQGSVTDGGVGDFFYTWEQTGGADVTDVAEDPEWSPEEATTGFTIPVVSVIDYTLTFRLTVTDDYQNSDSQTVSINVKAKNGPPVAQAVAKLGEILISDPGALVLVKEGRQITLDGSASSGGIGILGHTWVQVDGAGDPLPADDPLKVDLEVEDENSATATFTAPAVPPEGAALKFELMVSDARGNLDTTDDVVQVLIEDNRPTGSIAATLEGGGQVPNPVEEGTAVILQGAVDSGGVPPFTYAWQQTGGTDVTGDILWSPNSAATRFTIPLVPLDGDTLTFRLTVTDAYENSHITTAAVNVLSKNSDPVARAVAMLDGNEIQDGKAQEGRRITLDGSASSGGIGTLSHTWVQTNAGEAGIPDVTDDPAWDSNVEETGFTAPNVLPEGATLTFELTITDDFGNTATTEIPLLIEDNPPTASIAAALKDGGPIPDPVEEGTEIILRGTVASDGVPPFTYQWKQTGGTNDVTGDDAWSPNSDTTGFTIPAVPSGGDTLAFELTATDAYGNTDTAAVDVTMRYVGPQAAVTARLPGGAAVSGVVPEETVITLDGGASVAGTAQIVAYAWEQIDGPAFTPDGAWSPASSTTAFSTPAVPVGGGTLRFKLTVTDENGVEDEGTVAIEVAFQNSPPEADAGTDTTVNENDQITLDSSASDDPDVGDAIQSYLWAVTGIPAGFAESFDIPGEQKSEANPIFTAPPGCWTSTGCRTPLAAARAAHSSSR